MADTLFIIIGVFGALTGAYHAIYGLVNSDEEGAGFYFVFGILGFLTGAFLFYNCLTSNVGKGYDGNIIEISCYNSGVTYNCWTVSRVSEDDGETNYYLKYNNSQNEDKVKISIEKGDEIFSCFDKMDKNNAPKESNDNLSNSGVSYLCEGETSNRKAELLDKDLEKIFSMITGLENNT